MKLKDLVVIAVFAALLCVLAPVAVPVGPVPITLATFVIYLAAFVLGTKRAVAAVLLYLLLGLIGIPVFAGFVGGFQKFTSPTAGYLVGYLPLAAIAGLRVPRRSSGFYSPRNIALPILLAVLGTVVLYALGTAWFMLGSHLSLAKSLTLCVLPFLPGDAVKIAVAAVSAPALCAALGRVNVLDKPNTGEKP
ncbi:MAG: biotin transporter BioY [Oscillospiraceae bacterium]|jgi:biotin transport system substrate-specific component|nr:biotin transporter BioY [Oscillospiraceae bacterium]